MRRRRLQSRLLDERSRTRGLEFSLRRESIWGILSLDRWDSSVDREERVGRVLCFCFLVPLLYHFLRFFCLVSTRCTLFLSVQLVLSLYRFCCFFFARLLLCSRRRLHSLSFITLVSTSTLSFWNLDLAPLVVTLDARTLYTVSSLRSVKTGWKMRRVDATGRQLSLSLHSSLPPSKKSILPVSPKHPFPQSIWLSRQDEASRRRTVSTALSSTRRSFSFPWPMD